MDESRPGKPPMGPFDARVRTLVSQPMLNLAFWAKPFVYLFVCYISSNANVLGVESPLAAQQWDLIVLP